MGICVLFLLLVVFDVLFYWCHGFFTHNEDIVPFKCGGGEPCSCTLFHVFGVVLYYFLSPLISFTSAISLYTSVSAR